MTCLPWLDTLTTGLPQPLLTLQFSATRGLLVTDIVILNHGQVTRTTSELEPPSPTYHIDGRTFELSTGLKGIAPLHGGSLVVLDSNSLLRSCQHVFIAQIVGVV
ncbi:hypothetical protein TNCV_4420271 [Trichonephila clavipes]|nr:hypothetical protein TNCV_4420271 [Trichonephila clavipes]